MAFQGCAMDDQKGMSVVIYAPIHAPFQQCKSLTSSQRFERGFPIKFKNTLRADPSTNTLGSIHGYMKIRKCIRIDDRKLVVERD